jgi:hypothetical protein
MTKELKFLLGSVLLVLPFIFTASYAGEKPVHSTWEGTVIDTAINVVPPPGEPPIPDLVANYIDAQVRGSLGPASMGVISEFTFAGFCDAEQTVLYVMVVYSKPITTFKNGDQLWGDITSGDMCLDTVTGEYFGSAQGVYTGGTGRFHGATGSFTVDFGGTNLTLPTLGFGFGAIYGETEGRLELP